MTKAGLRIVLLMCSSFLYLYLMMGSSSFASESNAPELTLTGPSAGSVSEGYFRLHVEGYTVPESRFSTTHPQLMFEQSMSDSFEQVTHRYPPMGEFTQITLSGFSDGRYYFRAVVLDGEGAETGFFSNTVIVDVKHHSLARALTLFGIGAAIFLLLIFTILRNHFRLKREVSADE